MPTNLGVIGGRTYVSGPADYAAVNALQDRYRLVPLDEWGSDWTPPAEVPVQAGHRHEDTGAETGAGDDAARRSSDG